MRTAAQRDALLALARGLAQTRHGGVLSEALDAVLRGLGTAGCVYRVAPDGSELVVTADRGLGRELRPVLERLSLAETGWFVAQRAFKAKRTVVEADLASSLLGRIDRRVLQSAGWVAAAATPIVARRRVLGILCVADSDPEALGGESIAFLETAAHVLALALSQPEGEDDGRQIAADKIRTAQMAALGVLAAGVADELRGPLGALAVVLREQERLALDIDASSPDLAGEARQLGDLTAEARAALGRAREITDRLIAAVREPKREPVDLGEVARDLTRSLVPALERQGIQLEATVSPDCVVVGRRDELVQAVSSLLSNAIDAAQTAVDRRGPFGPRRVSVRVRRDGNRVVVVIEDSGPGVPADLRLRIFEPFFTTKPNGIGIGLTLARQTVMHHEGHLEIAPSQLGGALFRIVLPASEEGRPATRQVVTTPPRGKRLDPSRPPALVWIDDDELLLRSMKRALDGWEIATATTAAEAEEVLAHLTPEVVFCDVGLPDRPGDELHAAIALRDPALAKRFVFVTGGVLTPEVADYLIASGCPTLFKPVNLDEIRQLLDGKVDSSPPQAQTLRDDPTVPPRGPATVGSASQRRPPVGAPPKTRGVAAPPETLPAPSGEAAGRPRPDKEPRGEGGGRT